MPGFYTSLNDQDVLKVSGEDSEKFLQGQLTCDLGKIADGHSCLGAVCNNKGRVYASFRVLSHDQAWFLTMPKGVMQKTRDTLQKYIPFYKADMSDAHQSFSRFGLAGDEALQLLQSELSALPGPGQSLQLSGSLLLNISDKVPRYELWLAPGEDNPLDSVLAALPEHPIIAWELLDQDAGIFMLRPQDAEQYTPEELNMDLGGFVSFDKGCYTGQEIVARMHYRGKAKKRLFKIEFKSAEKVLDTTLYDDTDKIRGAALNLLFADSDLAKGNAVLPADMPSGQNLWLNAGKQRIPVTIYPLQY